MRSNNRTDAPIWVQAKARRYPIYIGYHLLQQPSLLQSYLAHKQVLIISHPEVAQHYASVLEQTCHQIEGVTCHRLLLPSGEIHKTLDHAQQIWDFLLKHHYHRDTVILALGGGVIGDLAGFSAACYLRGVEIIQCPTTLLAQIDAAIGGKTAVNHPLGKNLIGAFHSPSAVIVDLSTLATLADREFVSGLAELIKYAITLDTSFFEWLEAHMPQIVARDPTCLAQAVHWACRLKAQVVSEDETEQGSRTILNFGHTIGHALESLSAYKEWLHGEAVAMGMIVAAHLSLAQGWIPHDVVERLTILLSAAKLPIKLSIDITVSEILTKLKHDKKHFQQKLRWVLLKAVGQADLTEEEISSEQIIQALTRCGARD